MIHVVSAANRHLYGDLLSQVRDWRMRLFIDQLGWPLTPPADADGPDLTEVHLLALDEDGGLEASCRLRPFDGASLLAGPAAGLADHPVLGEPGCWELSCLLSRPPGAPRSVSQGAFRLALLEEALRRGATRLVGVAEAIQRLSLMRSGLDLTPLGPDQPFGRSMAFAFEIAVSRGAVARLRRRIDTEISSRLELSAEATTRPEEVEAFLGAAARLSPAQKRRLLAALRRAASDEN